jgi:hypothetical protein
LKSLGAEISEEKSSKGIEDDLHKIIGVCDACFKDSPEHDIEKALNSIVSILIQVCTYIHVPYAMTPTPSLALCCSEILIFRLYLIVCVISAPYRQIRKPNPCLL